MALKLVVQYTVILVPAPEISHESGIIYGHCGRNPALFDKEIDAANMATDMESRHPNREFVVGTITMYVKE